jgi:hypothetical protein
MPRSTRWPMTWPAGAGLLTGVGGSDLVQVVPRTWTHLLTEAAGQPVNPVAQTPDRWREYVARRTGLTAPEQMTEGTPAFEPFESGCNPADPVDRPSWPPATPSSPARTYAPVTSSPDERPGTRCHHAPYPDRAVSNGQSRGPRRSASGRCAGRGVSLASGSGLPRCLPAGPSACSPRGDPAAAGRTRPCGPRRPDRNRGPYRSTGEGPGPGGPEGPRGPRKWTGQAGLSALQGRGRPRSAGFAARRRSPLGPPRIHLNLSSQPLTRTP